MLKKFLMTTIAATALMGANASATATPTLAGATAVRASTEAGEGNALFGMGRGGVALGAILAALGIWGLVELVDEDQPTSP